MVSRFAFRVQSLRFRVYGFAFRVPKQITRNPKPETINNHSSASNPRVPDIHLKSHITHHTSDIRFAIFDLRFQI